MKKSKTNNISIIDSDLKIDGTLSSKGKLIIKGTVRGTIDGEEIVIAREGAVYSDARATHMTVGGLFEGEVDATEELVILRPEMEAVSHEMIYTTDDGSFGTKGFVTHALQSFIDERGSKSEAARYL